MANNDDLKFLLSGIVEPGETVTENKSVAPTFPTQIVKPTGDKSKRAANQFQSELKKLEKLDPEAAKLILNRYIEQVKQTPHSALKAASPALYGLEAVMGLGARGIGGALYGALDNKKGVMESTIDSIMMDDPKYLGDVRKKHEQVQAEKSGMDLETWKKMNPLIPTAMGVPVGRGEVPFLGITGENIADFTNEALVDPGNLIGTGIGRAGVRAAGKGIQRGAKAALGKEIYGNLAKNIDDVAAKIRPRLSHLEEVANLPYQGGPRAAQKAGHHNVAGFAYDKMGSRYAINKVKAEGAELFKKVPQEDLDKIANVIQSGGVGFGNLSKEGQAAIEWLNVTLKEIGDESVRLGVYEAMQKNYFPEMLKQETGIGKVKRALGIADERTEIQKYAERGQGLGVDTRDIGIVGPHKFQKSKEAVPFENMLRKIEGKELVPETIAGKEQLTKLAGQTETDPTKVIFKYIEEAMTTNQKAQFIDTMIDDATKKGLAFTYDDGMKIARKRVKNNKRYQNVLNKLKKDPSVKEYKAHKLLAPDSHASKYHEVYEEMVKKELDRFMNDAGLDYLPIKKGSGTKTVLTYKEMVPLIEKVGGKGKDQHAFLKAIQKFNKIWAPIVLLTPGFHLRNLTSNQALLFEIFGPDTFRWSSQKAAYKIAKHQLKNKAAVGSWKHAKSNVKLNLKELQDEMGKLGLLDQELTGQYGGKSVGTGISKADQFIDSANVFRHSKNIGSAIENHSKVVGFLTELNNMPSHKAFYKHRGKWKIRQEAAWEAAKKTNEALFNYANLSKFETETLKALMPFYTWTRKNSSLQIKMLAKYPNLFRHWIRSGMIPEGSENRADYTIRRGGIPTDYDPKTGIRKSLSPDMPWAEIGRITSADDMMRSMSPVLGIPTELASGKGYRGMPIPRDPDGSVNWLGFGSDKEAGYLWSKMGGPVYHGQNIIRMLAGRGDELEKTRQGARLKSVLSGVKEDVTSDDLEMSRKLWEIINQSRAIRRSKEK